MLEGESSTPRYHSFKLRKRGKIDKYHSFIKKKICNSEQDKGKQKEEEEEEEEEEVSQKEEERKRGGGGGGEEEEGGFSSTPLSNNPQICLAIYIAMAHAGLAFSLLLLYGLTKLLEEYWRPIQWAILCSMPLREVQTAMVRFWSQPLRVGLFETLIAVPLAIVRATTGSVIDSQTAFVRLLRRLLHRCRLASAPTYAPRSKVTFSKLMQWLVSFGLFVLTYERIGLASFPVFAIPGFIAYAAGFGGIASAALTAMSSVRRGGGLRSRSTRLSRYLASGFLSRLNTMVGIGLISLMIVGSISGLVFFSYKIGIESRDAVISLKTHLEENNYAERIGINQWMHENNVSELIETYTAKFYETLSQQIDSLAQHYNMTEIVDGFRHFLVGPLLHKSPSTWNVHDDGANDAGIVLRYHPFFTEKLNHLWQRLQNSEWKVICLELGSVLRGFLSVITREDLVEKMKVLALQSLDVSKRLFASGSMVLVGSANLLFYIAVSIVSGAAGLVNFISQLMVFIWLLYYLITSKSGGVMDHVLGMLPLSKSTRIRCAQVLDHAVSSVLLATAKITLFQASLTYLLFRFYRIHFLYVSTFLALLSAVLPITPIWLSSIPAAAQLAIESRYIAAVLLPAIHLILLDYGTSAIQGDVPGQSSCLTGLSILGGMALFPSVLEGAIMGPLLLTVMIALKNLYVEFVLVSGKEIGH